jgi:hypothetical protein
MKNLILLLILTKTSLTCRTTRNWKPGSITESIERSGAVIIGEVKNPNPKFNQKHITLVNARYYKGCGPSKVQINGYSSATRCGVDAPKDKTNVIVFVCKKTSDEEDKAAGIVQWNLNRYTSYAGQNIFSETNYKIVKDVLLEEKTCLNETVSFEACVPRKKNETTLESPLNNFTLQSPRKPFFDPKLFDNKNEEEKTVTIVRNENKSDDGSTSSEKSEKEKIQSDVKPNVRKAKISKFIEFYVFLLFGGIVLI